MSRSNNTELKSPATRFFEWNGDKGGFKYFDKERGEKGENVSVPLPFRFLVLDQLTTIAGYSDADQSGFWSNEIRDTKKETLSVRTKKGLEMTGLYEQVKEKLSSKGADYAKSVYIAYYNENKELVIGNIKMKGAAISAWIDFCKKAKVYEGAVQVKTMLEGKKGKTVYQIPVFEAIPVTPETNDIAIGLDKELQCYLTEYFARRASNEPEVTQEEIKPETKPEVSFREQAMNAQAERDADKPIDDSDDLPF